ncbi:MAG: hypothetical protein K2H48_04335 [Duncaniella sp.]|nr:hypothetical protein [Duncaniella sp.]
MEFNAQLSAENARRLAAIRSAYDPLTGEGASGERVAVARGGKILYLPAAVTAASSYDPSMSDNALDTLRFRHDFEYWAARCTRIHDKYTRRNVPFVLNRPQRRVVAELERMRVSDEPIRLIVLKARQWGCSTLVAAYMLWIQMIHRHNWNSVICAHTRDTSLTVRLTTEMLLASYPDEYLDDDERACLKPLAGMSGTRYIPGRGAAVTVTSSYGTNSVRGLDVTMAHLTEVAFWRQGKASGPEDTMRAVTSGITTEPYTLIVLESTAHGENNYFHNEWKRTVEGHSDKAWVFVPWYENEAYMRPVTDPETFVAGMDGYEEWLWREHGCCLEQICWYRCRRREYGDRRHLQSEYPTTPEEAFTEAFNGVFSAADADNLRLDCRQPVTTGEVVMKGRIAEVKESAEGGTLIWSHPRPDTAPNDYICTVDIGGRTDDADYSVITVMDRHFDHRGIRHPEVVATWRGHIDMDILAGKAVAMARYYSNALLVIESNSLESDAAEAGPYILKTIGRSYQNMYRRVARDSMGAADSRPGFHTNRRTKGAMISNLVARVRDGEYIERDERVITEYLNYQRLPGTGYGAKEGCHDDMLMTRAMALFVDLDAPQPSRAKVDELLKLQIR